MLAKAEVHHRGEPAKSQIFWHNDLYVTKNNIGYAQGIMVDGNPFEVECFTAGTDKTVAIYIPVFDGENSENFADPEFISGMRNGVVEYRTDVKGNEFAKILITLSTKDNDYAVLMTGYRPFKNTVEKKRSDEII